VRRLFGLTFLIAALLAVPATAQATVTIGSTLASAPTSNTPGCATAGIPCTGVNLNLPAASQAAGGLTAPINGQVVSWRASANVGNGIAMQVLRRSGDTTYTSLSTSSAQSWAGGISPEFTTAQPLKIGDYVALRNQNANLIYATTPGANAAAWFQVPGGPLQDGAGARAADVTEANKELLAQATIEPSSKLQFNNIAVKKKKGTATMTMSVPNPGSLVYPTDNMSVVGPTTVAGSGDFAVSIKATGSKAKKLKKKGKVGLTIPITFTPNFGTAAVSQTKVTLQKTKKKHKK
jgi:hypothetical protein